MTTVLYVLLIFVQSLSCNGITLLVNSSTNACLFAGVGCKNSTTPLIIKTRNKTISTAFWDDHCFTYKTDPYIENRSSILHTATNYTLCIWNVTSADAGRYIFERRLSLTSIDLYVLEKPSFPQLTVMNNGTVDIIPAKIKCSSISNSAPTGFNMSDVWFVNNSMVDLTNFKYYHVKKNTSVLFIQVNRTDAANIYSCVVTEQHGQSASSNYGVKLFPRSAPLIQMVPNIPTFKIVENESLTLSCTTSGAVPDVSSYTWYRNNKTMQSGHAQYLTLPNISRTDAGNYSCIAANGLEINGSDVINVDVLYGPNISSINETNPREGDNVNISCEIDSNPRATNANVSWFFIGSERELSTIIDNDIQLNISNIQRNSSGTYICMVNITLNPNHGQQQVRSSSSSVVINVLYQPHIKEFETTTLSENQTGNFSCRVNGYPTATVYWIYGPTNLTLNETYVIRHSSKEISSVLNVSKARCTDTGTYICVANNGIKEPVKRSNTLIVKCSPRLEQTEVSHRDFTVMGNNTFRFTEWFYAYPKPSFKIHKKDPSMSNESHGFDILNVTDTRFPYRTGFTIKKQEFKFSDIGIYILVAGNDIGDFNISYNIIYIREPDTPVGVFVSCSDKAAEVVWTAGWNGGSEQQFQLFYRSTKVFLWLNHTIQESHDERYLYSIYDLLPNQNYLFKVKSSNAFGFEESQTLNCTTTDQDDQRVATSLTAAGTITGVVLALIVIITFITVIYIRRKGKGKEVSTPKVDPKSKTPKYNVYENFPKSNQENYMELQIHNDSNEYGVLGDSLHVDEDSNHMGDIQRDTDLKNDKYENWNNSKENNSTQFDTCLENDKNNKLEEKLVWRSTADLMYDNLNLNLN